MPLRREPHRSAGCTPPLLPAKLLVVDRIRLPQPLMLSLSERDVARPRAHAALRHACFPLDRFHERMFAFMVDAWNYTHKRSAPMV